MVSIVLLIQLASRDLHMKARGRMPQNLLWVGWLSGPAGVRDVQTAGEIGICFCS